MRTTRTAAIAAATIFFLSPSSARAGGGRLEVGLLAGAAFPSYDTAQSLSSVDEYGTRTTNVLGSDAKTSLSYGVSVRYVAPVGLGVEVLYERARLDLDSTTPYSLKWDSVAGPQSETYQLGGSGKLQVDPLSVNVLYRAALVPRVALTVSGGVSFERIDLTDRSAVGLVTYVGDSIETFAAETRADESTWKTTWNAGLGLDLAVVERLSVFVDGRYYGNAKGTVSGRSVQPGSYAGLHLNAPVVVDAAKAAQYTTQINGSSYAADIDTKMFRAAVGIRYRF